MKRILGALGLAALTAGACGGNTVIGSGETDGGLAQGGGAGGGTVGTEGGTGGNARVSEQAKQSSVNKIDLLFMIDNSSSMADKQAILAEAVPDLVNRLVAPACVDPKNDYAQVAPAPAAGAACPAGSEQDFSPVGSIHVGVVTSSLGGHGTTLCPDSDSSRTNAHNNDNGHLITRNATTGVDLGFLDYEQSGKAENGKPPPSDAATVSAQFKNMLAPDVGVGQHGCGYEASLEAAYRFLIDPDPPSAVHVVTQPGNVQVLQADFPDATTLKQRADFLRPDSLVAVVMVTDENDCSLMDEGQAFLAIAPATGTGDSRMTSLAHGTSVCATDPNNPCCYNCGVASPPAGCPAPSDDPNCALGRWKASEDPDNLRCFHMKQRYGIDFLYPVSRYVDGYTVTKIKNRSDVLVQNPLFDDLSCTPALIAGKACSPAAERDPSLVYVAGIVGVPWQDIAKDPSDLTKGYKSYADLTATNVWPAILGDPTSSPLVLPSDPLMIESVEPRQIATTGNPLGAAALPQPPGAAIGANAVNGHEWDTSKASPTNSDLQYACVFDLPEPRDCTAAANLKDCDCSQNLTSNPPVTVADQMSPLCQGPAGYSTTQRRAKGYPGTRQLQVLQGMKEQGIVASICPKQVTDKTKNDYGYEPAIGALLDRLRPAMRGRCMPMKLARDPSSYQVPCFILEGFNTDPAVNPVCDCDTHPGRSVPDPSTIPDEWKGKLECICGITQLTAPSDLGACQTNPDYNGTPGWCYVDPALETASSTRTAACQVVAKCPAEDRRLIRFVGSSVAPGDPRPGATSLISCDHASVTVSPTTADPCAL